MRRVLHLGPCNSPGGMSVVIRNMQNNTPDGWEVKTIDTHGNSIIGKIVRWAYSRSELRKKLESGKVNLVHIHATHAFSWWRKSGLMKICDKFGVPVVVQIHSGKFDKFCSGISGLSVRRRLSNKNVKTLVLENRWIGLLKGFIPEDSEVLHNFSEPICERNNHNLGTTIKLLLMSRKSPIKGHKLALKIAKSLANMGNKVELKMTGTSREGIERQPRITVESLGWVSETEKASLLKEADFLISPSEFEGSSMSVIEAMVCGLPCIVSPASRETVGSDMFVVNSRDPIDWAQKITQLVENGTYEIAVKETMEQSRRYSFENNKARVGEIYQSFAV